jgi:hypothetical protein
MQRFELAITGRVLHGRFAEICAPSWNFMSYAGQTHFISIFHNQRAERGRRIRDDCVFSALEDWICPAMVAPSRTGESCNEETGSGNHRGLDTCDDGRLCHTPATGGDEGVMAAAG